mmetsp:Transcript_14678/g.20268  ORF Transcript_14678/g.20268 Transcript_14678/m.20268 type:complete len:88 (-) Transcript_14678:628-891(-)
MEPNKQPTPLIAKMAATKYDTCSTMQYPDSKSSATGMLRSRRSSVIPELHLLPLLGWTKVNLYMLGRRSHPELHFALLARTERLCRQ